MYEYKAGDRVMVDSRNWVGVDGWVAAGTVLPRKGNGAAGAYIAMDDETLPHSKDYKADHDIPCYYAYRGELIPLVAECATEPTPAEPNPEDLVRAHILRIANSYADEVIASGRKVVGFEISSSGRTHLTINAQK